MGCRMPQEIQVRPKSHIQRYDPNFSAESPHSNLSDKLDIDQVKKVNLHLAKVLRRRQKESGNSTMKIHVDKEYSENPMERVDVEETLTVQENGIKVAIPRQSSTITFLIRTWKVCITTAGRSATLTSRCESSLEI